MLEYTNESGDIYNEDEINQFAQDQNTTFDDIIKRNNLKQKSNKQKVSPGKTNPVAKKDAIVTEKNTASKSEPISSVSKKRKSLFEQNIETIAPERNLTFEESMNKAIKTKQGKDKVAADVQKSLTSSRNSLVSNITGQPNPSTERSIMLEKSDEDNLKKLQEQEKIDFAKGDVRLKETTIRNNAEYKAANDLLNIASTLPEEFTNELDSDIQSQIDRDGKEYTQAMSGNAGFIGGATVTKKYNAFEKEKKQAINEFNKANRPATQQEILNRAAEIYKQDKTSERLYSQKWDALENLDNYDDDVKKFFKDYNISKKTVADYDLAKTDAQKNYTQKAIEHSVLKTKDLEAQLKPADYKYTTQEELDTQNNLISQINANKKEIKDNANYYDKLLEKGGALANTSTSLKDDIELQSKDWGWWSRTGRKIWHSYVEGFGGSVAGGLAYVDDLVMGAVTGGEWDNAMGKEVSRIQKENIEAYESKTPTPRGAFTSPEAFMERAAGALIDQLPIILTTAAAPETYAPEVVGFTIGAVTGTGSKYNQMLQEQKYGITDSEGNVSMPEYNTAQLFAVPALFGAYEGGTEYVGGRAFGRMKNMFAKATKSEISSLLSGSEKAISKSVANFSKNLLHNYSEEIPSEVLNTLLGNATDKILLGKNDTNLLDNVGDTIFDTAVVSTMFATMPHVAGLAYKAYMPSSDINKLRENNNKIAGILKGIDYENLLPEEKAIIDSKIQSLKDNSTKIINNTVGLIGNTSTDDLLKINDLSKKVVDIKKQAQIINNSANLSDTQKKDMLSELSNEYTDTNAEYNRYLGYAQRQEAATKKANNFFNRLKLNKDINLGEEFNTKVLIDNANAKFKYGNGKELTSIAMQDPVYKEKIDKLADKIEAEDIANGSEKYSTEQKLFTKRAVASQMVNSNGLYDANNNTIYVNKDKALSSKLFTTARHEFFHKISENFANNMSNIGESLYSFVKEQHIGKTEFGKTSFAKRMDREFSDATNEIDNANKDQLNQIAVLKEQKANGKITESQFKLQSNKIRKTFSEIKKDINNRANEEVSTILAESLESGDIKIDKIHSENVRLDENGNVILNNAKDVFNFIAAYNESFSKTKSSEAVTAAVKGKVAGELITEAPTKTTTEGAKLSKAKVAEVQEKIDKLEDQYDNDEIEYEAYENKLGILEEELKKAKAMPEEEAKPKVEVKPKVELSQEDEVKEIIKNDKGSVSSDKVQKIYEEKGLEGAQDIINLFKPITKKIVDKRRDAPDFDRELLTDEIETGVGGILDLIKSYKVEKGVPLAAYINKQLPLRAIATSRRLLGKEFSKDVAEEKGLMAEEAPSEVKEKPIYKNALESKVFEPEVIKTMVGKILTNMRTLKSRIDEPVSLNRTITPLIAEIRDAMGKQLDIDVKTAMGGKKDNEFRNWLLKNKRYMLENMTTTWLMAKDGQGGIPQAIQKQIDGKWVSYPNWVGQKIDRETTSTDQAGRTSGAELVRRLPNVFNNVSDIDYLGQFIGPDGNPIRGRKESGAKAVAEEIAFDIVNNDLAEEGDIYNALSSNQQRLGYEELNNFAVEFSRQSERGNIKRSKAVRESIEDINNLPINIKNILIGPDGNRFTDYTKSVRSSGQVEKQFKISYKNIDLPEEYKNKILKSIKTLYRHFEKNKLNTKLMVFKIKEGENFEKYANRIVFNALSKEQSIALTLGVSVNDLKWQDDLNRINAQSHIDDFINDAVESLTSGENKISNDQALLALTRIFSRSFAYGKGQSLYGTQSDFYNRFLKDNNKFALKEVSKDKFTITYNGDKVNREIPQQDTSSIDIAKYIKEGNINAVKFEDRSKATKAAREDLKEMIDLLKNMYQNKKVTDTQLGLIFKSLGGNMNSVLKLSSELRYLADRDGYSNNPKDWVYEHTPPSSYLSRLAIGVITGKEDMSTDDFMQKLIENSYVAIIPKSVDNDVNSLYKSTMPFNYAIGDNPLIRYYDAGFKGFAMPALYDLKENKLINRDIVRNEFNFPNVFETQEAVLNSLNTIKRLKGISVFDFDDTVGLTKSNVLYTMPDGSTGKLNGAEFAKEGSRLLNEGAEFDFSEFSKVVEGKPGPMVEKMKKMIGKFGPENFFILTARPADSAVPIHQFLASIGIDIPLENITGLGNSAAQAKADWITNKAAEGYNDFYFTDDHLPNVNAVKNALDVLDVKSKIQQARAKFSKSLDKDFNQIIEDTKGIENYKVFSDVVARKRGAKKNKFDFYVPPSAADFELLLYNFMGKGTKGEEHREFFANALLKPYTNGNDLMDAARQSIKREYKKLNKAFPEIQKTLETLTLDGDFTYDQAIRVSIWNDNDIEIPGLSQRDKTKLTNLVNNDPELNAFKQGLIVMGRQGKGWVVPGDHWDSSTIISDLHNLTEGSGRKKFLGEFIENTEAIFGKFENGKLVGPNMNKIEAVYGTNVREALDDSIYRMINGKNRSFGSDRETSMWSNWVNGSTGTIMFLNTRSAALQLLGAINFLNFRDNNPLAATKAFADQPQYWKDFARIWNSDKMKERRGGLKEDVAASEIANAAAGSKNKVGAVVSYLLKIGYTPTMLADSFAIASGGAPYYRNRIKSYLKEGMTEVEAEKAAWQDFTKVSDETQQSGDPKDISKQQASGAGRLLLTFQNTAMQQSRIVKKAVLDLKNGRGDAKTNVSKIVYYLTVQNLIFSALQQGLFAVAFDDEDDDDKEKAKKIKTRNEKLLAVGDGVLDSILRGTGFIGGITATAKNMILKYIEERDKKQADYAKVVLEGANISPPIGSKLKKLYSGLNQTKYDKDLIKERGWGVMQDGRVHLGPMYSVAGKVVESTTNLPMDRLANKIENVSQALNAQNSGMQRLMIAAGWSPYSVGVEDTPGDIKIKAEGKATRKEEGKIKTAEDVKRKKDSIRKLPTQERLRIKQEGAIKRRAQKIKKRKMG